MLRSLLIAGAAAMTTNVATAAEGRYAAEKDAAAVTLKTPDGKVICRYVYGKLPADEPQTAVPVVGYLHPVRTPAGQVLTESKGGDHAWLRGVFVAWPQVSGRKDGGFWTCGKAVWKEPGQITNTELKVEADDRSARIAAVNAWSAGTVEVIAEKARIAASARDGVHVIDWTVTMCFPDPVSGHADPDAVLLKPWPFSGLTFHGRRVGGESVAMYDPNGAVKRGGSPWNNPKGNWPDAAWYDLTLTGRDGKACGLAIITHPLNGKAPAAGGTPSGDGRQSWNMNPSLRFIAPSVTAAKPFAVRAGRPLVLRYRIVAHDGPAPAELLNRLARELLEAK